ncbi:Glutamyl-tRNA amidotransferase subunit B, mitochondrial [Rhizodiscina lignyota]|uniref:Glutamyl-tRNA(Gln) amidotransferase subunit B, mitochondrial n=1 Tax=Rhizodiscina lignyota TaxID=1504668 RepID=A0A9P4IMX1_9PEZI|nr:Glutamyl-tRNA amidotransferase subunit B, mitochondrial [Rhizodiscina lignyota]
MTKSEPVRSLLFQSLSSRPNTLFSRPICHSCCRKLAGRSALYARGGGISFPTRTLQTQALLEEVVPFRKQLKDEAKRKRAALSGNGAKKKSTDKELISNWELTVGIELHAELNTAKKLFSSAATSISDEPNSHVALFDAAFPGSQPHFQKETLLPALRAAIALNCKIQRRSTFDRKHYFYQDQPAGYQITQYYEPFAKDGHITLYTHDGIDPADAPSITIPIKQIQMEQDTAKTLYQPPSTYLLDFNRVSHPLIEIISMPAIHHPATAAAYVRKIQSILKSVDAATAGMEVGGLRADVNVSIRRRKDQHGEDERAGHSYSGFKGLGQRTEIKNLSSLRAVSDAIAIERSRQIAVLESGGTIEGETRGFTLGSSETRKLRSKEGEIDYRYMPDPDIAPVVIGEDLVQHLRDTLPALPDDVMDSLVKDGVSMKDAKTLLSLEDGDRLDYYYDVVHELTIIFEIDGKKPPKKMGRIVANWVIHELGALLTTTESNFTPDLVPASSLALILEPLLHKQITNDIARFLFSRNLHWAHSREPIPSVPEIIDAEGLRLQSLSEAVYEQIAKPLLDENPKMVKAIKEKGQTGKIMWFVGQMMRGSDEGKQGKLEAKRAEEVVRRLIGVEGGKER